MRGRTVEINDPVRLRLATGRRLAERVAALARMARARALRENAELACVFIHEDDAVGDSASYPETQGRVQAALGAVFNSAHYVLTVTEAEAWLLLFPEAITAFSPSWTVPAARRNRDTGRFQDPKKIMKNEVASAAPKISRVDDSRYFQESRRTGTSGSAARVEQLVAPFPREYQ